MFCFLSPFCRESFLLGKWNSRGKLKRLAIIFDKLNSEVYKLSAYSQRKSDGLYVQTDKAIYTSQNVLLRNEKTFDLSVTQTVTG